MFRRQDSLVTPRTNMSCSEVDCCGETSEMVLAKGLAVALVSIEPPDAGDPVNCSPCSSVGITEGLVEGLTAGKELRESTCAG